MLENDLKEIIEKSDEDISMLVKNYRPKKSPTYSWRIGGF